MSQLALPYFGDGQGIMLEGCALGASPSKLSFWRVKDVYAGNCREAMPWQCIFLCGSYYQVHEVNHTRNSLQVRRGPGGGEHALTESISGSILHSHNFELGEEWYINLELELTFNVVSVYNVPILIDDNCISSAYQIVLPETFFFYLIKQDIICAAHVNFCTEHLQNFTHVLFSIIYLQGETSHICHSLEIYFRVWYLSHFRLEALIFLWVIVEYNADSTRPS